MHISKIHIENFKGFKGSFKLQLNNGINILVGDNEAGKSTVIEAIHLALTGLLNGKYLRNELTEYIFNKEVVQEYLNKLARKEAAMLPHVLIELFFEGDDLAEFFGDGNSEKINANGISLNIAFDDRYNSEYDSLINAGNIKTLPIEYYNITWSSFARDEHITTRIIPIKSALIDSASNKHQNGSDVYISRIIKEFLEPDEIIGISQAHRKMKESFMDDDSIKRINEKIKEAAQISDKSVQLSVDLSSKNAWEGSLMTYLEDIPFHYIGKGEQCLIKTKLALGHKKAKEANVILLEEPENHLSHTKLNRLIGELKSGNEDKQVIITTHSSFVANKLGLEHLILLNNKKTVRLNELQEETRTFFEKLSGYDTLRLLLCEKAILVEGDSDELLVQKAFMMKNDGKLPIEHGIDVISVGTSFLRFLEIAEKIDKKVAVVTDNDGNVASLNSKYQAYLGSNSKANIKICFDETVDTGVLMIGTKPFNYNTLEPKFLKANNRTILNTILGTEFTNDDDLHKYMKANKTACALKIFDSTETFEFPEYITKSIAEDGE